MSDMKLSSDGDSGWMGDDLDVKTPRRRNRERKPDTDALDYIWDESQESESSGRGRKVADRRRDIEDRLDKRRLRREIYDDYDDLD